MHFDLDEDQRALRDTVRRLAEEVFPVERTRGWAEPGGFDRAAWSALAELGTFAVYQPEERGGLALPVVNAVLAYQTLGACLVPGPLVAAALAADLDGDSGAVGGGEVVPAVVVRPEPGAPLLVEHLRDADVVYVLDAHGIERLDPAALTATPITVPLDPTTPLSLVTDLPRGDQVGDAAQAARWSLLGSLLSSALLVGHALRVLDLATAHAQQREQFGRPIGTFQAVKHMLADCFARGEVARAAVDAAGVIIDEPGALDITEPGSGGGPAVRAVAAARVLAAEAALLSCRTAIQAHGGMGFTWEVDLHLHLKRALLLETSYTTSDAAAEAVAQSLQRVP
ncbi:acyl-CoA dehydrogenase family protein [Parafrankia sp. EUN1f]|uniref:acyl-CoA dehydrogenase family protein n=1 Tax=Parafrankia sp. EUN1f TaxID=102897 RepID=UPI0001C446EB|nr:acyl-CoA dehydrogenase family protein [Parafrankia sp. EUN1f]EFC84120.1 acyl-CoA dehydrogenase domain protein [Parafrankia sp. EUN1f]